jgi:D-Tyr-tRNAtyr deacylase
MTAVVQRVKSAKLSVDGAVVSEIGGGLFMLLGVEKGADVQIADTDRSMPTKALGVSAPKLAIPAVL